MNHRRFQPEWLCDPGQHVKATDGDVRAPALQHCGDRAVSATHVEHARVSGQKLRQPLGNYISPARKHYGLMQYTGRFCGKAAQISSRLPGNNGD